MHSGFRSTLIVLAAGLVLAASSILSGAQQQASPLAEATAPAASSPAALPDAPAPQIELAAAVDPQSGQAQTVQQPAAVVKI